MVRIYKNMAQCLECKDVIVSKYRHDFVTCSCGNLSVDGGKDYIRRGYKTKNWVELSITEDDFKFEIPPEGLEMPPIRK